MGTRTHEERTARASTQHNFHSARAICFAWFMLVDFQVSFVENSCLFARKPLAAPRSRTPRRAELSWRVRKFSFCVEA